MADEQINNTIDNNQDDNPQGSGSGHEPAGDKVTEPHRPAWMEQLPDDLKGNELLTGFRTIGELGKKFIELDGRVKKSVLLPGDDATEEERAEFFNRLGRPETPDGYELKRPELPDAIHYDEEQEAEFRKTAHQLGLTSEQAKGLYDWYHRMVLNAYNDAEKARAELKEQAVKTLKSEWGDGFDEKVEIARRAVEKFGGDELKKFLDDSGLGDNPILVKAFYEVGSRILEDRTVPGHGKAIQSPLDQMYPSMK